MDTVRRLVQGQHIYFETAESILCTERNAEPEFVDKLQSVLFALASKIMFI